MATSTATFNGSITATGGVDATQSGFAYGTSATLATTIATSTLGSQTGTASFTQNLTGLTPSTTYYVRAYATNSGGTGYGSIVSFTETALSAPTVTVQAASSVTQTAATLNGNVTATGGATVTSEGFNYGLTTGYGSTAFSTGSFGTGAFTQSVSGLTCNTTYHYESSATNAAGTGVSADQTFATSACAPTITTSAASSVATSTATFNGSITATGGVDATQSGFAYGTSATLATTIATSTLGSQTGTASFTQNLTGLTPSTTYYFRAYATNPGGTSYGSIVSFTTSTAYVGPCDVMVSSTCAEAYSVTHAMTVNYAGNLFQIVRASDNMTLEIGQTNQVANLSGIPAFAAGTTISISKIHGQINGNDLTPTNSGGGYSPSACNGSTYACAPPFFIDPETGLPIVRTLFPTQLYNGGSAATGITAGTNAISVYLYGRNEGYSDCCGFLGPAHAFTAAAIAGTDFLPAYGYGTGHPYVNCSTSSTNCAKLDIEVYATNGADYTPTANQDTSYLTTWGGSGANTIKTYLNSATPIYSGTPAASMNVGNTLRWGGGGDGSHTDSINRDAIMTNSAVSASDYTAINSNQSAFYGARSPNPCRSTADFSYYFSASDTGGQTTDVSLSATLVAYGLRQMRASYWGPVADLRNSVGTVQTFNVATSGCTIEPAAATFCAANAPCTVVKLYNQGTWSSQNVGNVHDTLLDAAQATVSQQPTVHFNGQNGLPTMAFNSAASQSLCSSSPGSNGTYYNMVGFVGKRTGNVTSYQTTVSVGASSDNFGWANTANEVDGYVAGHLLKGGSLADGSFHSVVWEWIGPSTNQTTLYGDGSVIAQGLQDAPTMNTQPICIGMVPSGGPNYFDGEIAEVTIIGSGSPGSVPNVSQASTLYNLEKAAWATP